MRPDVAALLLTFGVLSWGAYEAAAEPVDARAIVRQTRAEEPDTEALQRQVARTEPAVVLARVAWLEAGALVTPGEVAAMHEVLTRRMRGTYQRTAWQYSAGLRNPRRESTHDMGRAPLTRGYPPLHREHWPRVLAAADEAVEGTLRHGCDTARPLEHWGGPNVDRASIARMLRDGMEAASCPGFHNTFLVRGEP